MQTVIVRSIPADSSDRLEELINAYLAREENHGAVLAAAFPSPDGEAIIVMFQKTVA